MARTARSLILVNAWISSIVVTLQILFPYQFYDSHLTRAMSRWTGLVRRLLVGAQHRRLNYSPHDL